MANDQNLGLDLPLFQAPVVTEPKVLPVNNTSEQNKQRAEQEPKKGNAKKAHKRATNDKSGAKKDVRENGENANLANENGSDGQTGSQTSGQAKKRVRDRSNRERQNNQSNKERGANKPQAVSNSSGSSRVDAKRQRRNDNRSQVRRRNAITEAEFLSKRENVNRKMIVREIDDAQQISILEDDILVEHYVSEQHDASVVGNVYLGRVQNVLPGMEAAFVDIGVGRNGVLYAGEVNWDESGLVDGEPKRIEQALKKGDTVLVQATKDPVGQKGARLTSQVTLAGRFLVIVPSSGITGISKKLPDRERARLKKIVKENSSPDIGIIIRTAAQGVADEELIADIKRLEKKWAAIEKKANSEKAPALLYGESDMAKRVVRETFNEDFNELIISGDDAYKEITEYLNETTPELQDRVQKWTDSKDIFENFRINEQLAKAFSRKVWLPSGGTLVIDRTEAMTVIDINTGRFTGNSELTTLEETVTANNLEAAEEIVRQLRLRDIGGIVVIDFIDMILESNRELVLRRLIECLMRDRTKHQVAEVTSLGLVQLTRKRVGQGLIEAFSTTCEQCGGKGYIVHSEPQKKDINAMIHTESPEDWYDSYIGASHELDDGSKIAKVAEVDDKQREENLKRMQAMAKSVGVSEKSDDDDSTTDDGVTDADADEESLKNELENEPENKPENESGEEN